MEIEGQHFQCKNNTFQIGFTSHRSGDLGQRVDLILRVLQVGLNGSFGRVLSVDLWQNEAEVWNVQVESAGGGDAFAAIFLFNFQYLPNVDDGGGGQGTSR